MVAAKSERIEVRVAQDEREHLKNAAAIVHEDLSAFVRNAAYERAEKILAMSNQTIMPSEQFDAMIDSLDTPDPAPYLHEVARRRHRFIQQ